MQRLEVFKLGPEDPNWETRIDEAFNRLSAFAGELRYSKSAVPPKAAKAFNKVVTNREFFMSDWVDLHYYGLIVAGRAIEAAKGHARYSKEVGDAIDQSALNLRDVLAEFDLYLATTPSSA